MKLNIPERVSLLQILPLEGDFSVLKVLRDLQSELGFSEEDHKKFKIKRYNEEGKEDPSGNSLRWNADTATEEAEIKMGEKALEIVKNTLLDLDKTKKLRREHLSLYEKFVQEKEKEGK